MDLSIATRYGAWIYRLLRHYVYRFETLFALLLFGCIWYYLQWLDQKYRLKFSEASHSLNKVVGGGENRRLSTEVRSWIENGFISVSEQDSDTWELQQDNVAVYAVRGLRDSMEDRFNIIQDRTRYKVSIFGIFDGHGGHFAADFVERTLFKAIMHRLQAEERKGSPADFEKILFEEIRSTDKTLVNITEKARDITGTTALVALIHGDVLTVANVGDSRGVMCVGGDEKVLPVSVDHKPSNSKEQRRIKRAGGWVSFNGVWRVAGILATSRALGDYFLKKPNFVTADPDITNFDLRNIKARFLILATDGLWDTVSNEEAVEHISAHVSEPLFGAKSLAELALSRGSVDNVSVMVVLLDTKEQVPG